MSVFLDLRTAILLVSGLSLYFFFHPGIPLEISLVFWGFFGFFYFQDAHITVSNPDLMGYEKNVIFPILYKRCGHIISPIIQCGIEILVIIFLTFSFMTKFEFSDISVTAFVFGLSHLLAYFSNKKIINLMKNR